MQSAYRISGSLLAAMLVAAMSSTPIYAQPADADGAKPAAEAPATLVERLIYVPYRNLQAVFDKQGASAILPYSEYLKLLDAVLGDTLRKSTEPPIAGVITSANYVGVVEGDVANITATLGIQALQPGWAEIPIKFGEAAIGEISSDSGKVLLRGVGPGAYALLLPSAGEHTVTLKLSARVRSSPEGQSIELDVPAVGITKFELTVPQADQAVELEPKLTVETVPAEGKTTHIKASVGSTEKITARWHPKLGNKPDMQLLTNATAATAVSVEDGLVHTDVWLQYEILRGQLEKLRIAIPPGQRILDVSSEARLKEWKAVEEDGRQILNVEFLSRLSGKATLEIHLERELPDGAFDVFGLTDAAAYGVHALDVVRESGQIAVRSSGDMTLAVEDQQGVQRLEEGEVDARLKRPGALYFKYYSPTGRLRLQAKPVEPRLLADHATHIVIREDRLETHDHFQLTIERAGVFELRFKIPENLTIENVVCDKMKQFDVSADKQTLTISLLEKVQGGLAVAIHGARNAEFAALAAEQPVPIIEPVGVELETGRVLIYAVTGIEVITEAKDVVSAQPDSNPSPVNYPGTQLVSAWSFTRRPVTIPTRLVRKPTRLTANVGTVIDVKQGQVQVKTQLQYVVEYAGLDTFRFSVPAALADTVQITSPAGGPAIKQKSRAAEAVDGWVAWTVVMQRDITGVQEFTITYDVTPTVDDATKAEKTKIELAQVLDPYPNVEAAGSKQMVSVSRITGEATVLKDRALAVTATAAGGDVEPIDVRELTRLQTDGFTAFRYYQQPVAVELSAEKFDVQGVVDIVASKALVEAVLDRSGTATYRVRYVLKSSERQRLAIDLPAGAEPLGVSVDRKPVSLEKSSQEAPKGWEPFYINVARTKASDQSFSIAVMYRLKLEPPPFENNSGDLPLRLPQLGGSQKVGVAVQQLRVAVWVPEEYALVGTPDNFTAESRPKLSGFFFGQRPRPDNDCEAWIGSEAGGVFDFPTEGRRHVYSSLGQPAEAKLVWWNLPFYTWVVSGAIVLIALILRNSGCENKLTIVFVAAFIAAAYALSDRDVMIHGLAVAMYGLTIGAALWLAHGLFSKRVVSSTPVKIDTTPPPAPPMPPGPSPDAPQPAT